MQINKVILQEYKAMALHSFSDGQIEVDFPDENDLSRVRVFLKPNDGFYKDGKFEFEVILPQNYPQSSPTVTCKTKMFHPNISYTGSICFNILSSEWESSLRLVDYVHGLLWLLYQPNLESRLNGDCPSDEDRFAALVKQSIRGGRVMGTNFPCALADPSVLIRERPSNVPRPITPRNFSELRAFFDSLAGPTTTTQPPRFGRPQPQPVEVQQPAIEAQPQQIPVVEQPAAIEVQQPQQPQPVEETVVEVQQIQEAAEVQQAQQQPQPVEVQQPAIEAQPQQIPVVEQPAANEVQQPQQPQELVEQPAATEAQQPQQPQQPQVVEQVVEMQHQPQQPAEVQQAQQQPQQPQQPRVERNQHTAANNNNNMRWARFILPAIQTQQPQQQRAVQNPVRRWAPVSPPLRFAGSVRVY